MTSRKTTEAYNELAAGQFWTQRLRSTTPLQAVLGYSTPPAINRAYDLWERTALRTAFGKVTAKTRALDVACGTGRVTGELLAAGARVTAIDVAPGMLKHVRKKQRDAIGSGKLQMVQASAQSLPFPDGSFDLITCCGLMEHLPLAVRRKSLREIVRVLSPYGTALVVVNNAESIFLHSSYPMTTQNSDGYFVGLVGRKWLERASQKLGRKATLLSANPLWAVLADQARSLKTAALSTPEFRRRCRTVALIDAEYGIFHPRVASLASHFLLKIC